jgi:polyphenol oxidase
MAGDIVVPDWPAPPNVRGLVTTRALGDMKSAQGRARLQQYLPGGPTWLRQVHGIQVVDAASALAGTHADASHTNKKNTVCVVMAADCMPVLLADERGEAVGVAHAGWRGLCAGVIEATVAAMNLPAGRILAWLGPAIGPGVYEIGAEVRDAYLARDRGSQSAFTPTRAGHWRLDLYAVARQRLAAHGVTRVSGGNFCTASEPARFFSYRRDQANERMAAAVWLV